MIRARLPFAPALALLALLAAGGCASERADPGAGGAAGRPPLVSHAGPHGWRLRVLHEPPPYRLVEYVEPGLPGVPAGSTGRVRVGKAWQESGRTIVASLCDAQWRTETMSGPPPAGRVPIAARRGGVGYRGWEATRVLRDGTRIRLRALCGATRDGAAFVFLSAPDQSALYEPVWEHLLLFNLGAGGEP